MIGRCLVDDELIQANEKALRKISRLLLVNYKDIDLGLVVVLSIKD